MELLTEVELILEILWLVFENSWRGVKMIDDFVELMLFSLAESCAAVWPFGFPCYKLMLRSVAMLSSAFFAFVVVAQTLGCRNERVCGCLIVSLSPPWH